jgi:hypothetical protein
MWKHKPQKFTVHSGEVNVRRCVTEGKGNKGWFTSALQTENWTLRKVYQKYLRSFEVCFWRTMEKISCIDHVRNEELLKRVREGRNFLQPIKRKCLTALVTSWIATAF